MSAMSLTFNPIDFANLTDNLGPVPDDENFVHSTDESVERGFVRVQGETDDGEVTDDIVPLFLIGIDPAQAQTEAEREAEYEKFVETLKARITEVYGDTVNEMNSTELARAIELYGEPVVPVIGADDVDFGCLRVNGEVNCDPTAGLEHGVLARAEDGSLYVTSSDDVNDESESVGSDS